MKCKYIERLSLKKIEEIVKGGRGKGKGRVSPIRMEGCNVNSFLVGDLYDLEMAT